MIYLILVYYLNAHFSIKIPSHIVYFILIIIVWYHSSDYLVCRNPYWDTIFETKMQCFNTIKNLLLFVTFYVICFYTILSLHLYPTISYTKPKITIYQIQSSFVQFFVTPGNSVTLLLLFSLSFLAHPPIIHIES